jgi:hypothetical protein
MLRELIHQASSFVDHLARPVFAPARSSSTSDDTQRELLIWRDAWMKGAHARWRGIPSLENPHPVGARQAAAWDAGWRWAGCQPDRRRSDVVRFAHPHRRNADHREPLMRRSTAAAAGLSALTLAGWLWRMRRTWSRSHRSA